jgi:hypothetical protein
MSIVPITLSTATAAAPAPVSAPSSDTDLYYKSKWGRVAILTGDNYQLFKQTCRTALVVASAWNIVNGTEARLPPQKRVSSVICDQIRVVSYRAV